ncbi:TraR/DksA C4-type zinc finger protein [Bosea sp. (in: a-proteobacteria)]|uniref:TraR/DksA C4-type zinc finger protein n=1 Tax=Bosea sp. (in: a-proteobacteria) TaxID=1871050 RepID=UPI00261BF0EA|nr:TraR/DksA C4-type zinc finger protein [Bosea sp. (in: a-proteobacteria)]
MCDPIVGPIALMGLSAGANSLAQSQVQKARDSALAAESDRQRRLDQEAAVRNAHAQGQYENVEQQQGERKQELADYYKTQTAAPVDKTGPVAMPASSSNVTVQATDKAKGEAKAFTDQQGEALGGLRSFGDLMGTLSRGTARDAGYIGQIGGFKKGSSAVLPYELEAANGKGSNMKLFGDVLGGLGKVGMSAVLSGATPFGIGAESLLTGKSLSGYRAGVLSVQKIAIAGDAAMRSEARRRAMPGARLCVACQSGHDRSAALSGYNRRGSKDSQLK